MANPSVAAPSTELRKPGTQTPLDDPIVPALLRFALPNLVQIVVQSAVAIVEVFFVSRLGTDAVAGISVVFPILTFLIAITTVGVGGAVASAIARSLGAGRKSEAEALAIQAVIIAVDAGRNFDNNHACLRTQYLSMAGRRRSLTQRRPGLFQRVLRRHRQHVASRRIHRDHSRDRKHDDSRPGRAPPRCRWRFLCLRS